MTDEFTIADMAERLRHIANVMDCQLSVREHYDPADFYVLLRAADELDRLAGEFPVTPAVPQAATLPDRRQ
jgi:hypothetical protein